MLAVEDDPAFGRFIRECLAERGDIAFEVHLVDRLEKAVAAATAGQFDVVLLDLGLPDSWGLETFQRFRQAVPGVPVIVLTGLAGPELDLNALRDGAQDYLAKGCLDGALLQRAALHAVERWRLEERLRVSEKMEAVGTLAGGIAHDFNNLLTCILGYENLVRTALPADSPVQVDLDEIRKAAESAAVLTKRLLSFARRAPSQAEPINPNHVLSRLEGLLRRTLPENITLRILRAADLRWTKADGVELEQVLINLAVNSRDAMPTGGTLTISTSNVDVHEPTPDLERGCYVRLTVTDTGCGMDTRTQSRLFEPFFTTKARDRGTGLGLATVFSIVRRYGGGILVDSEIGRGTIMDIYLPAADPGLLPAATPQSPQVRGTEQVLLVEDEDSIRELAARVLRQLGYRVLEAPNGHRALEVASLDPTSISLVVADVIMPSMGGLELVERLRSLHPGVCALYISGYTGEDNPPAHPDVRSASLAKPFTIDALSRAVRRLLDPERSSEGTEVG